MYIDLYETIVICRVYVCACLSMDLISENVISATIIARIKIQS